MINVIFIWVILFILFVSGIIFFKILRISEYYLLKNGICLAPILGIIGIINSIECINLFMPVQYIIPFFCVFFLWGVLKYYIAIKRSLRNFFFNRKLVLLVVFCTLLFSCPLIGVNELASIQSTNNDIMYYLSSMDWLNKHAALEKVVYQDTMPFYWCAEYMVSKTRLGFDGFGALVMGMFGLQPHQVFTDLGILFIVIAVLALSYMLDNVFCVKGYIKILYLAVIIVGAGFGELLVYQYVPQIIGIACLVAFSALSVEFLIDGQKEKGILVSFMLAGTVAVYAEFAAYLLMIYVSFVVVRQTKERNLSWIKDAFITGIMGLALNPVGIYRGVKLNLFVLLNANGHMENIDPYAGQTGNYFDAFAKMFGLYGQEEIQSKWLGAVWMVFLIEAMGVVIAMLIVYILYVEDRRKTVVLCMTVFFIAYEIYFRSISYAYGEYKHILSVAPVMIFFLLYVVEKNSSIGRLEKGIGICRWNILACILLSGIMHLKAQLNPSDLYYFNHEMEELASAAQSIGGDEIIGMSGTPATVHGEVYALGGRKSAILCNNISYYPYSKIATTKYRVYEGSPKEQGGEKILWDNGRFYLTENTGLSSVFYSGFHVGEENEDRWSCDKESVIVVTNYSGEIKQVSLCLGTEAADGQEGKIKVMYNGVVIAEEDIGNQIVTVPIVIKPDGNAEVYFYLDGNLCVQEEKEVGFKAVNYMLLDYSDNG